MEDNLPANLVNNSEFNNEIPELRQKQCPSCNGSGDSEQAMSDLDGSYYNCLECHGSGLVYLSWDDVRELREEKRLAISYYAQSILKLDKELTASRAKLLLRTL